MKLRWDADKGKITENENEYENKAKLPLIDSLVDNCIFLFLLVATLDGTSHHKLLWRMARVIEGVAGHENQVLALNDRDA